MIALYGNVFGYFFYIPLVCVEPTAVSRLGQQEAWSHMLQTSSVEKNADMLAGSTVETRGASKYLIDEAWKTCLALHHIFI